MKKPGETFTAEAGPTRTIAITRPVGKGEDTAKLVRKLGWTPFIFHTVQLKPLEQSDIFREFSRILSLGSVDWLVFMSPSGVDLVFDVFSEYDTHLKDFLGKVRTLAVGPKTKEAISRRGFKDVATPQNYSSEGIIEYLLGFPLQGRGVILTRSSAADNSLAKNLEDKGATVHTIRLYESSIPTSEHLVPRFVEELVASQFQAVLFTSASSVSNLFRIIQDKFDTRHVVMALKECLVGAIGPVTAGRLRDLGLDPIVPKRYLIEDAVKRLTDAYEANMSQPRT